MVDLYSLLKRSPINLFTIEVLPTEELPNMIILNVKLIIVVMLFLRQFDFAWFTSFFVLNNQLIIKPLL